MVSALRARGIDPRPLLTAAEVPLDCLDDPAARVPIAQYAALYNAVADRLDDEAFGLFPAPLRKGTFEFLCRAVLGSRTLGEALQRAARFLRIVLPDLEVEVAADRATATIAITERRRLQADDADPRRVFAFEWLLRLLHGLACWLAGRGLALESVEFPYPAPAHAAEYVRIYTEHASFGAGRLVARLDARVLSLPVRRDESDLQVFLEGAPGRISMLYRRDRELARAVRDFLSRSLPLAPTLRDAARELHVSPRTLHRRLREEGTSFREILAVLRRDRALAALGKEQRGVAETAAALGFSEPSAFFRAFQGWTGQAPSAYRRGNRAK